MKEITECIGDIGQASSNIFSTLDINSGFLQKKLDEDPQNHSFHNPGKRPIPLGSVRTRKSPT
jgi:hypothetical protein